MATQRRLISTGSPFEREFGFSRALVAGEWCFVSGVTGYDYGAMKLADGAAAQAEQCFVNIAGILDEAGFALADIVRVQYTLTDRALIPNVQPVLRRHLGEIRPAATMVIAGLIEEAMLVEVEVTAYRG